MLHTHTTCSYVAVLINYLSKETNNHVHMLICHIIHVSCVIHVDVQNIIQELEEILKEIPKFWKGKINLEHIEQIEQFEKDLTPLLSNETTEQMEERKRKYEKIQEKLRNLKQEVRVLESEWDEYHMKIACLAALRSKDPSTPVS